ncbi:MAG: hypothetical protein FWB72_03625 [Firmicutes bacterium]|nr:hypothetical protein [Bacillota bacterium]
MKKVEVVEKKRWLSASGVVDRKRQSRKSTARAEMPLPDYVIRRLPNYYRYFESANKAGLGYVTSSDISDALQISVPVIKQDFSYFGGTGVQGSGYNVVYLLDYLKKLCGFVQVKKVVVVSDTELGKALVAVYKAAPYMSVEIKASKDIDSLAEADIVVIDTTKDLTTAEVYEKVIEKGITNIINLTSVHLQGKDNIIIEQNDIELSFLYMVAKINNTEK